MKSFSTEHFQFISYTEMGSDLSEKIWRCRNLKEIRDFMSNPEPIDRNAHDNFVKSLTNRDDREYFCVMQDGILIGSVNIHYIDPNTVERGIFINPTYWGKGFSKSISREFYNHIKTADISRVCTKVKKYNKASIALQKSLGAKKYMEDDEYQYFELLL